MLKLRRDKILFILLFCIILGLNVINVQAGSYKDKNQSINEKNYNNSYCIGNI